MSLVPYGPLHPVSHLKCEDVSLGLQGLGGLSVVYASPLGAARPLLGLQIQDFSGVGAGDPVWHFVVPGHDISRMGQ